MVWVSTAEPQPSVAAMTFSAKALRDIIVRDVGTAPSAAPGLRH
jgi:hypothetical protein